MKVKMILPALTEAFSLDRRPIKYSLFPPLGLATLAGYLDVEDEVEICDEHVERIELDDKPDLVAIQVYITAANRAYGIADHYRRRGIYVVMGGLHVSSLPDEAALHADTVFVGPGEDTWPSFLKDFRMSQPQKIYYSKNRTLEGLPKIRRDLIKRQLYLVPNSIVVSRGCPFNCDFCYKQSFFRGGRSFYTQKIEKVLEEIQSLPGRHLFFLDDHLFGDEKFASALFDGMLGMGRLWQAAGTVAAVLKPGLLEKAAQSGLRSLFIGFESLNVLNVASYHKQHNLGLDYGKAVARLHDLGVMINSSFIFGMDHDGPDVFERTVAWAIENGIETATFHILTPYPGTVLFDRLKKQGRILHQNWDLYDTRHAVFKPSKMSTEVLENGYWQAYHHFYKWNSIFKSAWKKNTFPKRLRHLAYSGGWKKCEFLWHWIIKNKKTNRMLPLLEKILAGFGVEQKRN
jgi:radical SAM superfamily enzyme YgiQ (UPF0313 family)